MRHALLKKLLPIGICLGLVATLFAYADDPDDNAPTLTSNGLMTPRTRAVVSGESAYLLGPVETIADVTRLGEISISSDGGAVLIQVHKSRPYRNVSLSGEEAEAGMQQRSPEWNLVYWDVRTRVVKTLLRETDTAEWVSAIQWIPQTRIALIILRRIDLDTGVNTMRLMRVDTVAGTVRRVTDRVTGLASDTALGVSPSQPLAYLEYDSVKGVNGQPDTPPSLQVYTPQGLGRVIRLDAGVGALHWAPDGKSVYATKFIERTPEGKRTSRALLTLINLETGVVSHPEKLPTAPGKNAAPSPYADWGVGPDTTAVTVTGPSGQSQETTALWMRAAAAGTSGATAKSTDTTPRASLVGKDFVASALLVATNARLQGYLIHRNSAAVLFTRDGSLCAAPVFRLSRTAFEQGIRGVQRQMTLTHAKQVGLAILMYSQDYDENYPMPGSGVAKSVEPYLKSKSSFHNPATGQPAFVYTLTGSTALAEMTEPINTQLGYITGPGGRAILWADGHATWQDDPPTP